MQVDALNFDTGTFQILVIVETYFRTFVATVPPEHIDRAVPDNCAGLQRYSQSFTKNPG